MTTINLNFQQYKETPKTHDMTVHTLIVKNKQQTRKNNLLNKATISPITIRIELTVKAKHTIAVNEYQEI